MRKSFPEKALRFLCWTIGGYFALIVLLGLAYRFAPPVSTLMLAHWAAFHGVKQESVAIGDISPHLLRAVVQAEDARFCEHGGVDWESMNRVIETSGRHGPRRGASTISMQVAKNLFLWPHRSYLRKALEVPVALYLDAIWPKRRMMEVYLSVAEWGDGVFGAEAAAREYFRKSSGALTPWEAALLAAALPSPLKRHPGRPSSGYRNYARRILGHMHSGADISCLR